MSDKKYFHKEIEAKWQKEWEEKKVYSPDLDTSSNPYFNLMMFPYPSAEGLHVGNMYAFTGTDVFGRYMRMSGKSVFEPIGLDGFGIHSENYAMKIGRHPKEQAVIAEKNYYRQLKSIGNGFDWTRTVETYNPDYYMWTQWIFIQMFKHGLAYRKKAEVNWCPSCKTVLSDEQVISGKCERCSSEVERRELEQWFFRITKYAQRLLDNIENLNWTEKVKIAQRNWIGRSEGANVSFPLSTKENYILLHGFTGSVESNFFPWMRDKLEQLEKSVWAENLPNTENPIIEDQVRFVLSKATFDKDTILLGHSLGAVVALKVLERIDKSVKKLVLAAGFMEPGFLDHKRPFEDQIKDFDLEKIKRNAGEIVILRAQNDTAVPQERADFIKKHIGGSIIDFVANDDHITGACEPVLLEHLVPSIEVFTTRPDTLYGATFMAISPEHPLVSSLETTGIEVDEGVREEIKRYVSEAKSKSTIERTAEGKEKTGVFSGLYAVNPVNGEKIPVWIADYVLMGYGTGAIMAVPAHDARDFAFAKKYNLPIRDVIDSGDNQNSNQAHTGSGALINSGDWNGLKMPQEMDRVLEKIEESGIGKRQITFHLRDWLISRQRYWGPPIPMIYCALCSDEGKGEREDMPGWYSVPNEALPVLLPDVQDWKPMGTGKAPLASHPEFYNVACPSCGRDATRETDVSDTFLDSAWYFFRYISTDRDSVAFDIDRVKKWLPVHSYIGGAEHSVLHLLYARFVTMVLNDLKLIDFEEPFARFFAHGLIIKDGAKMSKSKGNVVVPDEYIAKYGADTLRLYLMFLGPFSDGGDFRDSGIEGMHRFVKRLWKLLSVDFTVKGENDPITDERMYMMHKSIKKVSEDINSFSYNTAIASLMEWSNFLHEKILIEHETLTQREVEVFLKLIAPFAPHMTEEMWQSLHASDSSAFQSIHSSSWPVHDEAFLVLDTAMIIIQVNGKKRGELTMKTQDVPKGSDLDKNTEEHARKLVEKYIQGEVRKTIYVSGKIINFVV